MSGPTELERFAAKCVVDPVTGCWRWTGALDHGYGRFNVPERWAHRWAYVHFVGPIPPGRDVDHECHNRDPLCSGGDSCLHRACVNPDDLVARSHAANTKAAHARILTCRWGHPLRALASGRRRCPTCHKIGDWARRHGIPMDQSVLIRSP